MPNFVRGFRLGRMCVVLSGAPFLFSRFLSVSWRRGLSVSFRQFELLVYRLPASAALPDSRPGCASGQPKGQRE